MPESPRTPPLAVEIASLMQETVPDLVALQHRHLKANLIDLSHGFLNWETPLADLITYADFDTSFTAHVVGELVAYVLTVDLDLAPHMTNSKRFLSVLDRMQFDDHPVIDYRVCVGQLLVDIPFRNRRIAQRLYVAFLEHTQGKYDLRVSGMREQNRVSYYLHRDVLGMQPIGTFGEQEEHQLLVWDIRETARAETERFLRRVRQATQEGGAAEKEDSSDGQT